MAPGATTKWRLELGFTCALASAALEIGALGIATARGCCRRAVAIGWQLRGRRAIDAAASGAGAVGVHHSGAIKLLGWVQGVAVAAIGSGAARVDLIHMLAAE